MTLKAATPLLACALATSACLVIDAQSQRAEGSFSRTLSVSGPVDLDVQTGSGRHRGPHRTGRHRPGGGPDTGLGARQLGRGGTGPRGRGRPAGRAERRRHPPRRCDETTGGIGTAVSASATGSRCRPTPGCERGRDRATSSWLAYSGTWTPPAAQAACASAPWGEASVRRPGRVTSWWRAASPVSRRAPAAATSIVSGAGEGRTGVGTGSGDVRVTGVRGPLSLHTASGNIEVEGTPTAPWNLAASSGDINVVLSGSPAFDLVASSSSGRVESDAPVTVSGRLSRRALRGQVRGGGPSVAISTASGNIEIR